MNETFQKPDSRNKIDEENPNKEILKMKNLGNQTETSNSNFNNGIEEMEERMASIDDMIKELCISGKGNVIIKPPVREHSRNLGNYERPNLRVIRTKKGEETQIKERENIL